MTQALASLQPGYLEPVIGYMPLGQDDVALEGDAAPLVSHDPIIPVFQVRLLEMEVEFHPGRRHAPGTGFLFTVESESQPEGVNVGVGIGHHPLPRFGDVGLGTIPVIEASPYREAGVAKILQLPDPGRPVDS